MLGSVDHATIDRLPDVDWQVQESSRGTELGASVRVVPAAPVPQLARRAAGGAELHLCMGAQVPHAVQGQPLGLDRRALVPSRARLVERRAPRRHAGREGPRTRAPDLGTHSLR